MLIVDPKTRRSHLAQLQAAQNSERKKTEMYERVLRDNSEISSQNDALQAQLKRWWAQ